MLDQEERLEQANELTKKAHTLFIECIRAEKAIASDGSVVPKIPRRLRFFRWLIGMPND